MPRAITAMQTGPGYALYQLGRREAFTLQAVSFVLDDPTFANPLAAPIFDVLDAVGGLIYRIELGQPGYAPATYNLAPFAQGWTTDYFNVEAFPGPLGSLTYPVVSASIPMLALTGSCVIRAYAWTTNTIYPVDPFTDLVPQLTVPNLHLWVQDSSANRRAPAPLPPLLAHVAD